MNQKPIAGKKEGLFASRYSFTWPSAAMVSTLVGYLLLCVILAYIMDSSLGLPIMGVVGAVIINLIVLFFVRSEVAFPLYLLVAGPSVALSLSSSGILSRLYIGNLLFFLVTLIWLLLRLLPNRKSGQPILRRSLLAPLISLIVVGTLSIIYSHIFPDPNVSYMYPHSTTSVYVTNAAEMMLLIGLPMFLVVVPGVVRTVRHVHWSIIAYMIIGSLYALGTIFAAPLGLYSKEVILGVRRPQVFGSVSSSLGTMIELFASIAFCQALYATTAVKRTIWGTLTVLFSIGVIMTFGRESWIGLFLAFGAITIIYTKNWKILLVLLIVPIVFLLIPGASDFFNPSATYGSDRLKIWQDAINIWWYHAPVMGTGAGNYQFFDNTYGLDIVGVAHNQYLQMLAEMGIQGLICLLWIMVAIGWVSWRSFRAAKTKLSKSLALAYTGYFVSIIFGGFFTASFVPSAAGGGGTAAFVESSYRWLLLGLVLSIPNWESEAARIEAEATTKEQTKEIPAIIKNSQSSTSIGSNSI